MKKTLIVVDMQKDFIDGSLGTKEAQAIVGPVKQKIKEYKERGDEIIFTVEARSFIYHQVRNMVGTLKEVGNGRLKPEDVKTILEACDRTKAGISAPACGLYLNKVMY